MTAASLRRLRVEQDGFTLIEMLVVIVTSTVIVGALFTMLDVVLHNTTRTYTQVDATQRARTQMEQLMNELHSACVAGGVTPVQSGSTATTLIFVSQFGSAASLTPVQHQVSFSAAQGTVTDTSYPVSGGTSPNWTFSSTPSQTVTLLTNVTQSGSTPVFQYFAYQQVPNGSGGYYTDGAGNPYMLLQDGTTRVPGTSIIPAPSPLATPLSTASALQAAEVSMTLSVGPGGGTQENPNLSDVSETVNDGAVLRLTPAANHTGPGTTFNPCQ